VMVALHKQAISDEVITCKPTSALLTASTSITHTRETPDSVYITALLSRFPVLGEPVRSALHLATTSIRIPLAHKTERLQHDRDVSPINLLQEILLMRRCSDLAKEVNMLLSREPREEERRRLAAL